MRLAITVGVLMMLGFRSKAQSNGNQATSVEPNYPQEDYAPKAARRKKTFEVTYDAQQEFYELQEETWKAAAKEERKLIRKRPVDKTLPPYFGHKRPVKIRPMDKRKYCKVCGIYH